MASIPENERIVLSDGWLTNFKKRLGLREEKRHGEAGSVDLGAVEVERRRIQDALKGWNWGDVYNEDETGLFYQSVFKLGIAAVNALPEWRRIEVSRY